MGRRVGRRGFLRGAGAGLAAAGLAGVAGPAEARDRARIGGYVWLAGDHHLHSLYSNDAMYPVADQVRRAIRNGLDWLTITDHGNTAFASHSVGPVHADLSAARQRHEQEILVFQGLEWNIPGAEHTTLMLAPGPGEAAFLQQFVSEHDARVKGTRNGTPENEALAVAALKFIQESVAQGRIPDALVLPNHPSRQGIDSPHELRAWQDAAPQIVIGMEGAPGHQAAGLPTPAMGRARGLYDGAPGTWSFPGYPVESYRTHGGFDWMTATVGGVWDSLLAEGRPWWITATSDGHQGCGDWVKNPVDALDQTSYDNKPYDAAGSTFNSTGRFPAPVNVGRPVLAYSSLPPGAYSKTWVGATGYGHREVMDAMRAGRIWACHGDLISGLDVRIREKGDTHRGRPMGGRLRVKRGTTVEVLIDIRLTDVPNHAGLLPELARVDLVLGRITGPVADRDAIAAPDTRVVKSWETGADARTLTLTYETKADEPFYVRVRGTDGKRTAPGLLGAAVDPAGPAIDVPGTSDPWEDLWFYGNPIFVEIR